MDEIVKQAMAKWPNVPHCFGWLALDARGNWRMRDDRAQKLNLAGDKIGNAALVSFINRNYLSDAQGRWYFQNGPQRVYVNLEATPYIAHTDPWLGFVLHTGEILDPIDGVWITDAGRFLLASGDKVALVDDRDMAQCLPRLHIDGIPASDEQLLIWLNQPAITTALTLEYRGEFLPVQYIVCDAIAASFGFVTAPESDCV